MNHFFRQLPIVATLAALSAHGQSNPSTSVDVKAAVKGTCQIVSAAEINFNLLSPVQNSDRQTSGNLRFWCTKDVPYSLVLDMGQNVTAGKRRMKGGVGGADYLPYDVVIPAMTGVGSGPAVIRNVVINATIRKLDINNASVGPYKDTLTVTVQN